MSNIVHNLDENIPEYFEFVLGGNTYKMVYPTTEQIKEIQKVKDEEAQTDKMLELIESEGEGVPNIKEALANKNVKVLARFRDMLIAEMGDNK